MTSSHAWMIAALGATALLLTACERSAAHVQEAARVSPATSGPNEGAALSRVRLTEEAAKRLGIKTAAVGEKHTGATVQKTVPYSAVLYDTHGATWVYTNPEPLVFVRTRIALDHVDGDQAIMSDGPASGTSVVTIGALHLSGSEPGKTGGSSR